MRRYKSIEKGKEENCCYYYIILSKFVLFVIRTVYHCGDHGPDMEAVRKGIQINNAMQKNSNSRGELYLAG